MCLKHPNFDIFQVLYYPEAGHLIEPPYSTFCEASFHKLVGAPLLWGGEAKEHVKAQEHSWVAMQDYLKRKLCQSSGKL